MLDQFLFVGLPYLALFVLVVGSIYRFRKNRFSYSALSSQFLERKQLMWGILAFHVGIFIIIAGHLIPFLLPGVWQSLVAYPPFLFAVEALGAMAAVIALVGLGVLLARRIFSAKVQAVTSVMDLTILVLLLGQVALGLGVALSHRWGAVWSTQTTTPYLWSLLAFQPRMDYVADLPPMMKLHLVGAWIIFLLVPFSRLVHMFTFPLSYLWRPPQKVLWTNSRRFSHAPVYREAEESRRYFLRGAVGIASAAALLSLGVMDKLVQYFRGPTMTPEQEAGLVKKRLQRLQLAAGERELELERMQQDYIFVARLAELSPQQGRYFIDYQMRPALAFRDTSGLPLLISAKCTHLGCTVASSLDQQGRILCPCHMSYFDLHTGAPAPGAVATVPLPHLGWALMDPAGEILLSQDAAGEREGSVDPEALEMCSVYIARKFEETV